MGRISLRTFLAMIALLAGGLGAITSQSRIGAAAAFTVYWTAILLAVAGALVARGGMRAFCVGCSVFGLGYWLLAFEAATTNAGVSPGWALGWMGGGRLVYRSRPTPESSEVRFLSAELIDLIESSVQPRLVPGSPVTAQYNGGAHYTGLIRSFDGTKYIVAWDDGTLASPVPAAGVRGYTPYVRTSAHAVLGLLFAVLGGVAARVVFAPSVARGEEDSAR